MQLPPFGNRLLRLNCEDEACVAPLLDTLSAEWGNDITIGSYPVRQGGEGRGGRGAMDREVRRKGWRRARRVGKGAERLVRVAMGGGAMGTKLQTGQTGQTVPSQAGQSGVALGNLWSCMSVFHLMWLVIYTVA